MTRIAISDIRLDGSTQVRKGLNHDGLTRYQEAMQRGDVFPPIVIYNDGVNNWLADGFHRVYSALAAGFTEIDAEIHEGDFEDADLFAASANSRNGKRLEAGEQTNAALKYLKSTKWQGATVREIAKAAGVHYSTVARAQKKMLVAVQQASKTTDPLQGLRILHSKQEHTKRKGRAKCML